MKKNKILDPVKELADSVDIKTINAILQNTELADFEMNKSTISNIAEWALNGDSDSEIRQHLSLNKNQWAILTTICPTLLLVIKETRALADLVIAGSVFQTAIGGRVITKQQPVKIKKYDANGKCYAEEIQIVEIKEELPPNPLLLKFLAEHKLSEKMGEINERKDTDYKKIVDSLSPKDRALLEAYEKANILNNGSSK